MCNHENIKCIKTTGEYWSYKCFDRYCGQEWVVDKINKTTEELKLESEFKREFEEIDSKKTFLERFIK